ncbi:hypothetical protein [Rhodococcus wratislaviensis]
MRFDIVRDYEDAIEHLLNAFTTRDDAQGIAGARPSPIVITAPAAAVT